MKEIENHCLNKTEITGAGKGHGRMLKLLGNSLQRKILFASTKLSFPRYSKGKKKKL